MKLLTKKLAAKLRQNQQAQGEAMERGEELDLKPVVKFFMPWGAGTWLLTEMDEDGRLFGLCDLGLGSPELGYVMLQEIEEVDGPFGLKIERDRFFKATKTIGEYAEEAREKSRVAA